MSRVVFSKSSVESRSSEIDQFVNHADAVGRDETCKTYTTCAIVRMQACIIMEVTLRLIFTSIFTSCGYDYKKMFSNTTDIFSDISCEKRLICHPRTQCHTIEVRRRYCCAVQTNTLSDRSRSIMYCINTINAITTDKRLK